MKANKVIVKLKNNEMKINVIYGEVPIKDCIFVLILSLVCLFLLINFFAFPKEEKRFREIPKKSEYAEVIGKRTESNSGRKKIRTYIVKFKLEDDSEKEFAVGANGRHVYNALRILRILIEWQKISKASIYGLPLLAE